MWLAALPAVIAASPPARAEANLQADTGANLMIRSDGDCPSGPAVIGALRTIRPDQDWAGLSAVIQVMGDRAQVTLGQDPNNRREIAVPPGCADRANRLAFVIAVWSSELPARPTGAPILLVAVPAPAPAPPTTTPLRASTFVTEVGLSGFYSMVAGWAPGVEVEVGRLRRKGWWGARVVAGYQSTKSLRVDIGASYYDRAWFGAALVLQREWRYLFLASDWGLLGALIRAHGDGYSQDQSASGLNLGFVADARGGVRLGPVRIWADLSLYRWARKETIQVDPLAAGAATTSTLPAWDAHLGMGASMVFD